MLSCLHIRVLCAQVFKELRFEYWHFESFDVVQCSATPAKKSKLHIPTATDFINLALSFWFQHELMHLQYYNSTLLSLCIGAWLVQQKAGKKYRRGIASHSSIFSLWVFIFFLAFILAWAIHLIGAHGHALLVVRRGLIVCIDNSVGGHAIGVVGLGPGVDGVNIIEHGHGKGGEHLYLRRKQRISTEQQRSTQIPWVRAKCRWVSVWLVFDDCMSSSHKLMQLLRRWMQARCVWFQETAGDCVLLPCASPAQRLGTINCSDINHPSHCACACDSKSCVQSAGKSTRWKFLLA